MSNNSGRERAALTYLLKQAKDDLVKECELHVKTVEQVKADQREFLHTVLNDVDMITNLHSAMDVPFKIRDYTKALRERLPPLK
jgi:hypothetical protein